MDRLTITQRIKIIKTYYKNCDSATATLRALRGDYGLHNRSTTKAIGKIVKKFEESEVVTNIERTVYHRFARSAENIAIVSESVADLYIHPYKIQLMQQLKPADHSKRSRYMEWVLE